MGCVSSTNFAVLINGIPTVFFRSSRRFRQGCPLSPLLFLLIVEGLSILLKKLVEEDKIKGVGVAKGIIITHLLFVDDIILFGRG
jgi:mannosylglycoprotein endo-beta-mannosidase